MMIQHNLIFRLHFVWKVTKNVIPYCHSDHPQPLLVVDAWFERDQYLFLWTLAQVTKAVAYWYINCTFVYGLLIVDFRKLWSSTFAFIFTCKFSYRIYGMHSYSHQHIEVWPCTNLTEPRCILSNPSLIKSYYSWWKSPYPSRRS